MAKKGRVLIIDDDEDFIETTGALLEFEGFEIQGARTVEDGMELIKKTEPDVILLDIMFPEKKTRGFEAAEEIKELYPSIPVFAFSAINREFAFDFAKEDIKADEFINKPVETETLIELISTYID